MSPSNSFPRLLGSVSPTSPGNGSPKAWWVRRLRILLLGGGNSNICYFHPYLGKWSKFDYFFQMGWNHQLVFNPISSSNMIQGDKQAMIFNELFFSSPHTLLICFLYRVSKSKYVHIFQYIYIYLCQHIYETVPFRFNRGRFWMVGKPKLDTLKE